MTEYKDVNDVQYVKVNKFKFTIPINPTTKKNSSQIIFRGGHPKIIPSQKFLDYQKEVLTIMKKEWNEYETIDELVNIQAIYYRKTKHTVDLINLHSALHDIMVKGNLLEDDSYKIIESTDGSRVKFDKDNPRTEVEITTIK